MGSDRPREWRAAALRCAYIAAAVLSLCTQVQAQQMTRADAAACTSCVILHLSADAVGALRDLPAGALEGMTIVVDAPAVRPLLLDAIRAAGATPGLLLTNFSETVRTDNLASAQLLILSEVGTSDEATFRVRTLVTSLRAGPGPAPRILLAADAVPERLSGYVDGLVQPGRTLSRPTIATLIEVSLQTGVHPALVRVDDVDPHVLAAFVAQRALASEVSGEAQLTVHEIVARHQAQRRRQEDLVQQVIARGTTSLMFEVPGFVAPVTVTARTTIYRARGVSDMTQEDIRVNGAAIAGGDAGAPPQLPLIEPERVATPPLTITLNDSYRYALLGRERVGGADTYVVSFQGSDAAGRAWIDTQTFALRRLHTVQARLTGAIVASEQHEEFGAFEAGAAAVWLPTRTSVFQMYEGAGHRTPIHRVIDTPRYDINPVDFEAQLQAAHASAHVMLRETPQGFRYLLRDPTRPASERAVAVRAGERIRTAVAGVLIDPNITVPLPFAGVSYVDLNFLDTGAQLNAFFGGTYGQLSWSVPSLGGTRWQAHGRVFAIAAKFNDRSFLAGVEQHADNITQRPALFTAGLLRPLRPRLRMRLGYELDYTGFDRAETTSERFVVPVDAVVHSLVTAVEAETGAWTTRVWWSPARRQRWRPWGELPLDDREVEDAQTFQRFGVTMTRTLALERRLQSRVEVAWMAGVDLDRFSRYSFNAFDNRLRGYPTASIRYDRGAVMRSVTSWSPGPFRLDGFADIAVVRDPAYGEATRGYPGVGFAGEVGGPLRTLWSVEWGYGFNAYNSDGRKGTHAVRVSAYRSF